MNVPKFIRKRVYKKILKEIESKSWKKRNYAEETYLCTY